jgi:hypothetical protein
LIQSSNCIPTRFGRSHAKTENHILDSGPASLFSSRLSGSSSVGGDENGDRDYLRSRHVKGRAGAEARGARTSAVSDVARNGIPLKPGERAGGTVTFAEGAASLRGRVAPDKEGARLPLLIVHLVPAETASADEVLRYAEIAADRDGAFEFKNMAPGKYCLLVRAAPDDESGDRLLAPVAWDANERAKLRREAEALKVDVELKPCQRIAGQVVKYSSK